MGCRTHNPDGSCNASVVSYDGRKLDFNIVKKFGLRAWSHCFLFVGLLQSHGNVVKWLKKEGDKVGYFLFLVEKTSVTCMMLFKTDHNTRKMINLLFSWQRKDRIWKFSVTGINFGFSWQVEVGDVLCEIETDKATVEFESQEEG